MKDVQVWIKSALVPLADSIDNSLRLELVDLFKISSSFSSCIKSIGSKSLTAALLSPDASDFLMQDGYMQLSPHSHSATVAVESGSLSLPLPLTAPNKAEVLVEQRLGTYTGSPLLTTITALSCQPLQKSTRLDPPLSLQRPQHPQHRTPLSTLQSTHQIHIPIQSKQHLQPSSHVPTPRASRMEEGIATCR